MPQTRGVRKSAPKVRSGCSTCKIFHVKCDEAKPYCRKCKLASRICDGYASPFRIVQYDSRPSHSPDVQSPGQSVPPPQLILSMRSPAGLRLDLESSSLFEFFCHQTAPYIFNRNVSKDLTAYLINRSFWWPSVKHAVQALGAEYRLLNHQKPVPNEPRNLIVSSCENYNLAVRTLNERLTQRSTQDTLTEEVLATCFVLICVEVLREEDIAALANLESALKILHESRRQSDASGSSHNHSADMSKLERVFSRLDVQAALFMETRIPRLLFTQDRESSEMRSPYNISDQYDDIHTARQDLDDLSLHVIEFLNSARMKMKYAPPKIKRDAQSILEIGTSDEISQATQELAELLAVRQNYLERLKKWALAFVNILVRCPIDNYTLSAVKTNQMELCEIAILWVTYLVLLIRLSTSIDALETSYDCFLPEFKQIVAYSRMTVDLLDSGRTCRPKPSFQVEIGVTEPLYVTAIKCRDLSTRYAAVDLLRQCPKEGVWEGKAMASIAAFAIGQEEMPGYNEKYGDLSPLANASIPDELRIHGVVISSLDRKMKVARLRVARPTSLHQIDIDGAHDEILAGLDDRPWYLEWSAEEYLVTW